MIDKHWLKETHKDIETEELANLAHRAFFLGSSNEYATLKAELERRREEKGAGVQ